MADFKENTFRIGKRESAENGNNCRRRKGRYRKEPWERAWKQGKKAFSTKLTAKNEEFRKSEKWNLSALTKSWDWTLEGAPEHHC